MEEEGNATGNMVAAILGFVTLLVRVSPAPTPSSRSFSWQGAVDHCETLVLAGYDDWRIPSLKELFSIGVFSQGWPYFDEFDFDIAGTVVRKDEQFWTSNYYVGTTHGGQATAFGANHGTGQIKACSRWIRSWGEAIRPPRNGWNFERESPFVPAP